jgi:twinkle protein
MIDLEGAYDLDRVLMKAEELVYRKGIRILVVDPFNKIPLKSKIEPITGNRINDYTNTYLSKLNEFAVKFDTLVILVAHPVKMEKLATGKRAIPDFYDVKGGGEFYDMCHHGIVVHRDYDLGLTLIRTLKVKFGHLGENNADAWFKYNINNGRLTDIVGDAKPNENPVFYYDNDNWVTKDFEKAVQKEIFSLKPNEDEWYNKEPRELDEVPF